MRKIIFVDDEPGILGGLKRMLRSKRDEWDMTFVDAAQKALVELDGKDYDLIVSDMRMPEMDGATLLTEVQKRFPDVVRIVLSGHTEPEALIRVMPVAHQFLSKPCNGQNLLEIVKRTCDLQDLLRQKSVKAIVGKIESLPPVPQTYESLTRLLMNPGSNLREISNVVEQDPALAAKILQLVNSAFFGLSQRVSDIHTAITYLGTTMLRNLVLSVEVFKLFKPEDPDIRMAMEKIQKHSFLTGQISKQLLNDRDLSEDAFMAGILHDVGKLIIMRDFPLEYKEIQELGQKIDKPLYEIEYDVLGTSHAEIGAYLLGIWGIPNAIVEAVAHHHNLQRLDSKEFGAPAAVYVANKLAHAQAEGSLIFSQKEEKPFGLDTNYLEELGVKGCLPKWIEVTKTVAEAPF